MSTRQNKKRKGRGNVLNRERTVTTLTEGPEAPFLSTSSSDDLLLPSPFPVSATPGAPSLSPVFSMSSNFPTFPYSYMAPMSGPFPPQQSLYSPQPLPPGQNDLEILERLKETIKSNQHEFFKPVPQPTKLASLYLGPRHVPPHPEQIPQSSGEDRRQFVSDSANGDAHPSGQSALPKGATSSDPISGLENSRRFEAGPTAKPITDSPGKSMDMDPPGLNTQVSTGDASVKFESESTVPGATRASAPGYQKYDGQALGRSVTEKSITGEPPYAQRAIGDQSSGKLPPRDSAWPPRDSGSSQDDVKPRLDHDRIGANGRPGESRFGPPESNRWQRPHRDYDRDRDRDRERDRDRDFERERDRDRRGPDVGNRFNRDDRRGDDRFRFSDSRRPPPEQRHYEPRYDARNGEPPRRWDSKASNDSNASSAPRPDDRPADTRVPRPLGEERSFESRPPRPITDERPFNSRPPPSPDTRDHPPARPLEERITKPGLVDNRPLPDRITRPGDDRRPPPPLAGDRQGKPLPADDRRPANSLPVAGSETGVDRTGRPPVSSDDRRPPPPSPPTRPPGATTNTTDRGPPRTIDDRRLPPGPPSNTDRQRVPTDDRRPPGPPGGVDRTRDDFSSSRPPATASSEPVATTRAPPPDRTRGLPPADDRSAPRQVSLEERISRQPSLQERISSRPGEQPPKSEDRVTRPAAVNDERPSVSALDDRPARVVPAASDDRLGRPPISEPTAPPRATDARTAPTESARGPPPDRLARPEDRGRPPVSDRFTAPAGDRGASSGAPPARYNYASSRPLSLVRDEPRPFKARGATISPRHPEYRPVDRPSYPDRYELDRPRERRPDAMDVDPPTGPDRFSERPPGYRRASPPPYGRQDRPWPPPGEPYTAEAARRAASPSAPGYGREWREDERGYDEWERRNWERERPAGRDREYDRDRDGRFVERDAPAPGWETREERDRRVSGGFPPGEVAAPVRPFDSRPLSARLSDGYPPVDERDRPYERSRYPPPPPDTPSTASYSRVRARSPSPPRRGGIDDLRPPLKRTRDEAYGPGYYSPPGLDAPPRDYPPPRARTPAPVGAYYDESRPDYVSPAGAARDRERDFVDREGYPGYERRETLPMTRMAPPRSPPSYGRGGYGRDERRYPAPPPRP